MRAFLEDRIRLVRALIASDINVAYADLVLILCSVISACAARRWPGRNIDRRRFIEVIARYSSPEAHATWVSVPALIVCGHVPEAQTLYGQPGQDTRLYRDEEIDLELSVAQSAYPDVDRSKLRNCTYAALIYEWLRCGYAHEYCPHTNISSVPPSRQAARVSYIGRIIENRIERMISFHLEYLIELAQHHAAEIPQSHSLQPAEWWIDCG